MVDPFPINTANIISLFAVCILYGILLVAFASCMRVLCLDQSFGLKPTRNINFSWVVISIALMLFATLDIAFGLRQNLEAFVYYHGPGGAVAEFANVSRWVNVQRTLNYALETAIGDGVLLYRCYVIWSKQLFIILPFTIVWMATLACGITTVYIEYTLHKSTLLNASQLEPFIEATLILTLSYNILVTSLIIWKIRSIQAMNIQYIPSGGHSDPLTHAMRIMLDSGLMYTLSIIVVFGTYLATNNAQYVVSECITQIIAITFNVVIIRVDNGKATGTTVITNDSMHFGSVLTDIGTRTDPSTAYSGVELCTIPGSSIYTESKVVKV